jgi:hypothetical protein
VAEREEQREDWPAGIHRVFKLPGGEMLVSPDVDLEQLRESKIVGRIMVDLLDRLKTHQREESADAQS